MWLAEVTVHGEGIHRPLEIVQSTTLRPARRVAHFFRGST
jgi:hypothetical protein